MGSYAGIWIEETIINFINNFVNNGVCPALQ